MKLASLLVKPYSCSVGILKLTQKRIYIGHGNCRSDAIYNPMLTIGVGKLSPETVPMFNILLLFQQHFADEFGTAKVTASVLA
jgi:hypothetical protein